MKFKVGDRVEYEIHFGTLKGTIISIDDRYTSGAFAMRVKFDDGRNLYFTSDGRYTLTSPVQLVKIIELDKKINKILSI